MKALIPLLSKDETAPGFFEPAVKGAKEVIGLLVIDTNAMPGSFGFAASEINKGNSLMQDLKELVHKKKKKFEEITEWGETFTKIDHTASLHKVDAIVLRKQDNQYFEEMEKKLREKWKEKLKVI